MRAQSIEEVESIERLIRLSRARGR